MFIKTFISVFSRVFFAAVISAAILSAFVARPALGEIREGARLESLVRDAKAGDWVAFDIDHTLLVQVQAYGSEVWFSKNIGRLMREGLSNDEAFKATVKESRRIHQVSEIRATESDLPALVKGLQQRGVVVFAFTARNSTASEITKRQLREIGLDFSSSVPPLRDGIGESIEHAIFKDGVLYSNEKSKGDTFAALLRSVRSKPNRVFMADDKKKNLSTVEKTASENGIAFEGIRYSGVDHLEHTYDQSVADYQRAHFLRTGILLGNAAASELVLRSGLRCAELF